MNTTEKMSMDYSFTAGATAAGGRLRRLPAPYVAVTVQPGMKLLAVHRPYAVAATENMIFTSVTDTGDTQLWWCAAPRTGILPELHLIMTVNAEVKSAAAMGATVTVACSDGLRYIRWTGESYADMGTGVPRVALEYRLVREPMPVTVQKVTVDLGNAETTAAAQLAVETAAGGVPRLRFGKSDRHAEAVESLTDAVHGMLQTVTADAVTARGRFWLPFMVRSGVRLADGSVASCSPSVLMLPSAGVPLLEVSEVAVDSSAFTLSAVTSLGNVARCRLEARITSGADRMMAEVWDDYIDGLEIAVTEPIFTYDPSAKVQGIDSLAVVAGLATAAGQRPGNGGGSGDEGSATRRLDGVRCEAEGMPSAEQTISAEDLADRGGWLLTAVSDSDFAEAVTTRSVFHRVLTLTLTQLREMAQSGEWTPLIPESGELTALTTAPLLADTLRDGDRWDADSMAVFNGRLTAAPGRRMLPEPYPLAAHLCHVDGNVTPDALAVDYRWNGERLRSYVRNVTAGTPVETGNPCNGRWIYVPDEDARYMLIETGNRTVTLPLTRHPSMNGAYWYGGRGAGAGFPEGVAGRINAGEVPDVANCAGMLLTSTVGNPMVFEPGSRLDLSGGKVMGLRGALRPMSEGQFGAWELYAFTERGVWALTAATDGKGTWASQRLVTPRGAASPDGITAMESGVAFVATDGAVLRLTGSTVTRLDEKLEEERVCGVTPATLPGIERIAAYAGHSGSTAEAAVDPRIAPERRVLAYDPVFRLLVMFRRGSSMYARVWSARDSSWGLLRQGECWERAVTPAEGSVQPLFAASSGARVVRLGDAPADAGIFALTARLSSDTGDVWRPGLLRITGTASGGGESLTLFGSNDTVNWLPVKSAVGGRLPAMESGTPRRYYIAAITATRGMAEIR